MKSPSRQIFFAESAERFAQYVSLFNASPRGPGNFGTSGSVDRFISKFGSNRWDIAGHGAGKVGPL